MNQTYQKFIGFKCDMNIYHGNQPITHICVDKNCKSSLESYSVLNGKRSIGKMNSSNSFLLCRECVQSTHLNHNILPIEQFIRQAKTESNSNIFDINKQSPNYQLYEQKKNNALASLAKLSQKITMYGSFIKAKELSESSDQVLNQRLITQNLQQQERIFTLEGNNYSSQVEFENMLKEVQEGLLKNKNVLKQYDLTKKEEEVQLKELDLIQLKLNQETSRILQFFDKDLSLHVNQKLSEYIAQTNKQNQGQAEKISLEELNQEKKTPVADHIAFEQISKLFSSGGKSNQNQQDSEGQLQKESNNQTDQQKIVKQRLLEIQNLNPSINNNSTPTASKTAYNQNNSAGFSNKKQGKFSSAMTTTSGFSDSKQQSHQLIQKSATTSAIKGYSLLSAIKNQTPQQITNENDSVQQSINKNKETPAAFASVFPQQQSKSSTSKIVSPSEKRAFGQNVSHGSNIVFVTNQYSTERDITPEVKKSPMGISAIRQQDTNVNHLSQIRDNCKIKNIGGNLSPISKPSNVEDDCNFEQTAKEIIQENHIDWLETNEDNLIDRGQFLLQGQRKVIDEDFEVGQQLGIRLNNQLNLQFNDGRINVENDEDNNLDEFDEENDDEEEVEEGEDFDLQSTDLQDQDKENENLLGFGRTNITNQYGQISKLNSFKNMQAYQGKPQVVGASQELSYNERKKEKRIRKRQQKKLKKQNQQQELMGQQKLQMNIKQAELSMKVHQPNNLNELYQPQEKEQQLLKGFQYSSYEPKNKKNNNQSNNNTNNQSKKGENGNKQQLSQQQIQQISVSMGQKETNFQNILNLMKTGASHQNHQQQQQVTNNQTSQLRSSLNALNTVNNQNNIQSTKMLYQNQNIQNTSTFFDGDNSPTLSNFSTTEMVDKLKKKIKTNNQSNQDQSYSSIQNASTTISHHTTKETFQIPPQTMYTSQIRSNPQQQNSLRNNNQQFSDIQQKLISQQQSQLYNINLNDDQNALLQLQNLSSQHSQASVGSYKRESYMNAPSLKQDNYQAPQNLQLYNPPNTIRNSYNQQQQQPHFNQPINYSHQNQQQPTNFNNFQRNSGRFGQRQPDYSSNQMMSSSTIQSSQESHQAHAQSFQSSMLARHNSLVKPQMQQQNSDQYFGYKQASLETATPIEEPLFPMNNKTLLERQQKSQIRQPVTSNINYSNPYSQLQSNSRVFDKNKPYQPDYNQVNNNNSNSFNNQVTMGLEQIQQQIEFTNSLKEQLEKKIEEEQYNSAKYSQCSSTKRLKFQLMNQDDDDEETNSKSNNADRFGKNYPFSSKFNLNEKLFQQNESVSSPNYEDNHLHYGDDLSPVLYSPGVQFSPVDSEERD